jgi:mono/diheme cytochrome c family protein
MHGEFQMILCTDAIILFQRSVTLKLNLKNAAILCLAAGIATPVLAEGAGADIYKAKCAMCHGVDGTSNTPAGKAMKATSFKDPAVAKASEAELIGAVNNGKNKMPAYAGKLTDDQIKSVVGYIRTLQK